ncbi:MAG TPA: tetratricopeptide repeat protein, partial [Blastocatellia bacterium]|nr:tetratricopeptide repeat protein [Blastocatellia bacterium]
IDYFQKAIELRPMLPDGYSGLGMAFVETGRPDEAIGALRRALSFAPHDYQVHAMLGRAQMLGKGLFREASFEYEQSLKLNPKAGWAALQLALCCSYLPDFERGIQAARLAVEAQEQYISGQVGMQIIGAFVRLGHLYYIAGSYDDAIAEYYRELVFLRQSNHALRERTSLEVHQKLVCAYVRQGNSEDANRIFDQLNEDFEARLSAGGDDPFTRYYMACACAMMGRKESALQHLRKAVETRPAFNLARARVEIDFENLRGDSEFESLINPQVDEA